MRPTPDYSLVLNPARFVRNIVSVAAYDLQTGNVYNGLQLGVTSMYTTRNRILAAHGVNIPCTQIYITVFLYGKQAAVSQPPARTGSIALLF